MNNITEGKDMKYEYYFKHYEEVVDGIFYQFFNNLSPAHFESYVKSSPESFMEITQFFSKNYYLIEDLCLGYSKIGLFYLKI